MQNLVLTFVLFLVTITSINAQSDTKKPVDRIFEKGQLELNVQAGLLNSYTGKTSSAAFVPLSVSADYMVGRNFSIGGFVGYSKIDAAPILLSDGIFGEYQNTHQEAGLRLAFHMNKIDNLDFYGGTTITYTRVGIDKMNGDFGEREEQLGIKPVNTSIIPMAFVGGKYALNQKLSVNAELTYGVAIFKMGVSYRLF